MGASRSTTKVRAELEVEECLLQFASQSAAPSAELVGRLAEAILAKIRPQGGSGAGDAWGTVVKPSREHRPYVVAILARAIASNDRAFEADPSLRPKIASLLDDVLSAPEHRKLGYVSTAQTFLKLRAAGDMYHQAQNMLRDLIGEIRDLDSAIHQRQAIMRHLNSTPGNVFIKPLIPRVLLDQIPGIFESGEGLLNAPSASLAANNSRLQQSMVEITSQVQDDGTEPVRELVGRLATTVQKAAEAYFQESAASKPANLLVLPTEKKYPLHEHEREIEIAFLVENEGTGAALDVQLTIYDAQSLDVSHWEIPLGSIPPGKVTVPLAARVTGLSPTPALIGDIAWRNADGLTAKHEFHLELQAQREDVDWESLSTAEPYDLEPVTNERELIGRNAVLNDLQTLAEGNSVGSAYVHGQKRVGKTSIVKTLGSRLRDERKHQHRVVYLDGGEYVGPEAELTIRELGRALCARFAAIGDDVATVPIPDFDRTLSPLSGYLEGVLTLDDSHSYLIVLDEFDELPIDLYKKGPVGDGFFLTLRSLSNKPRLGIILVGGEKMEFILNAQGQALNKFTKVPVTYFERGTQWADFRDLVRNPSKTWLEISDEALLELYDLTAGHPYFTKLVCREMFRLARDRRDCHITRREIGEASLATRNMAGAEKFAHFWEDGIFQSGPRREEVSVRRRKVLLGLADCLRKDLHPTVANIALRARAYGADTAAVEEDLREFERRGVLHRNRDEFHCVVRLFEEWLLDHGPQQIITLFTDPDAVLMEKSEEANAYVRDDEIQALVGSWDLYRGRPISGVDVRNWLQQFGDSFIDQRLMFRILQGVQFYGRTRQRELLREAHGIVQRSLAQKGKQHVLEGSQKKRGHVLVSYLDGPSKSGAEAARTYADENGIYVDNVVERGRLRGELGRRSDIQALVFVDDFVGSGSQSVDLLKELRSEVGTILIANEIAVFFVALCGFDDGFAKVQRAASGLGISIQTHLCDHLTEAARCFSAEGLFADPADRSRALETANRHGEALDRRSPLGFKGSQATVVFADGCPNNTLPILWKNGRGWHPLFARQQSTD